MREVNAYVQDGDAVGVRLCVGVLSAAVDGARMQRCSCVCLILLRLGATWEIPCMETYRDRWRHMEMYGDGVTHPAGRKRGVSCATKDTEGEAQASATLSH